VIVVGDKRVVDAVDGRQFVLTSLCTAPSYLPPSPLMTLVLDETQMIARSEPQSTALTAIIFIFA